MKIVVIGASGLIGTKLVKGLRQHGHVVVAASGRNLLAAGAAAPGAGATCGPATASGLDPGNTQAQLRDQPGFVVSDTGLAFDRGELRTTISFTPVDLPTADAEILAERGYTQTRAAEILGLPQPKLSRMLRGQFRGFSERKLMDFLTRLGRDVEIVVRRTPRTRAQGAVSVRFC
jgi:predicted XRE-type DNA-binding protein